MCLTQILEVNPDLVHPPCERPAQDDAGLPVVAQPFELCPAFLAMGRDLAHPNLVTNHLNWLGALTLEQATYNCPCPNTWPLSHTPTFFIDCPCDLLMVVANATLTGNCLLCQSKG